MAYRLPERPGANGIVRESDGAFIPADSANVDWQDYQVWLAAGNAPTDQATGAGRAAQKSSLSN